MYINFSFDGLSETLTEECENQLEAIKLAQQLIVEMQQSEVELFEEGKLKPFARLIRETTIRIL